MHAFLVVGTDEITQKLIDKVLTQNNVKTRLNFNLQKIEDCKELQKNTKYTFSQKTAIVIKDIDTSTPETLNSFLKTLEEPSKNLIFLLTATRLENVLPTIVSRCEIIKPNRKTSTETLIFEDVEKFLKKMNFDQKVTFLMDFKDREKAITFLENVIVYQKIKNDFSNMDSYLKTIKALKSNGNLSLQLTNLLVTMNRYG